MGKEYFKLGWDGKIYTFECPNNRAKPHTVAVKLPDGVCVGVTVSRDYLAQVVAEAQLAPSEKPAHARLILDENDRSREFKGSWHNLIELLNAAAATNSLFTVYLPKKEFERLAAGKNLMSLKKRLSPRAAAFLYLEAAQQTGKGPRPALVLYSSGNGH